MAHENSTQRPAPLAGVRILAVEQMQSMPYATQLLAQLGADVVKIEDPQRGEAGRSSRPSVHDLDNREVGATFLRNNLFKRSVTLDVRTTEGRDLLLRMAPNFDVVAENFKPGTADKLGFGYSDLVSVHPSVIYVSVSGFGSAANSPYSHWPAYSATVEAMSGLYEANRTGDEPPRVGVAGPLGDIGTAVFAVIGTLTALVARGQTGQSQRVDVAMAALNKVELRGPLEAVRELVLRAHLGATITTMQGSISVSDYLMTRCVESVVHGSDLTPPIAPDPTAQAITSELLLDTLSASAPELVPEARAFPVDQWIDLATGRARATGPLAEVLPIMA
jgi:hypothetical protein